MLVGIDNSIDRFRDFTDSIDAIVDDIPPDERADRVRAALNPVIPLLDSLDRQLRRLRRQTTNAPD